MTECGQPSSGARRNSASQMADLYLKEDRLEEAGELVDEGIALAEEL